MLSLGLPSTALVGKQMPKKAFYERLKVGAEAKEQFVHGIERIEMTAALKEASIHVPASDEVKEIDVLSLRLRSIDGGDPAPPRAVIELVARSVPNRVLFVCLSGEMCKLLVVRGKLRETEWTALSDVALELRGSDLGEIWDSLCSQVVFGTADPERFAERLERAGELASLREQLGKLQKRRRIEKQIARRNVLWDQIKSIEKRIAELEAR